MVTRDGLLIDHDDTAPSRCCVFDPPSVFAFHATLVEHLPRSSVVLVFFLGCTAYAEANGTPVGSLVVAAEKPRTYSEGA